MRTFTILMGMMATGCGTPSSAPEPEAAPEEAPAEEAAEAATEGAAAEAAAAPAEAMGLAALMTAKADHLGKEVVVAAVYSASETHDEMTHMTLATPPVEGAEPQMITCMAGADAGFAEMEENAPVTVKGTLAEADGKVMLENCMKHEMAQAEEGAEAGGEEAHATEGEAAEGEAAEGAAPEGDAHP